MKIKVFLCCVILTLSTMAPVLNVAAATGLYQETSIEYIEQGITLETTITVYPSLLRANSVRATRQSTYKDNGVVIATVILDVTFGYDGSSAWVSSSSVSKSTSSGWKYSNEELSSSGATAFVTAVLTKYSGIIAITTVDVDISLTCSKNGTIS